MNVTDTQLYLSIGLPVFAFFLSVLAGIFQTNSVNARLTSLESSMSSRFSSVDNRLTRVEAILERH